MEQANVRSTHSCFITEAVCSDYMQTECYIHAHHRQKRHYTEKTFVFNGKTLQTGIEGVE